MNATAANLMERVLPETGLRQWVLTFPFPWRRRLSQDGALLGKLTRIFLETVQTFYAQRAEREGALGAKTGAVTSVQRTSSDMRLNPHLHAVFLDGAWYEESGELCWQGLGQLKTSEVGAVLESTVTRIERHLRRRGLLWTDDADPDIPGDPESNLAASAVSGQTPPAGPQWVSGLAPLPPHPLAYDKPLLRLCSTGSRCTRPPARGRGTGRGGRLCCATCCARPSGRSGSSRAPTAWCASR